MNAAQSRLAPSFGIRLDLPAPTGISTLARKELLALVRLHKLVLVRGLVPTAREELLRFAAADPEKELIHWNFGPVMEMRADPNAENYLFSSEAVPYHWDGAFHEEPRVLVFNCIQAPNPEMGGETTFCDTETIWQEAGDQIRKAWKRTEVSYETEKKAHYGGRITRPIVARHPDKDSTVLRYAEPVGSELNPVATEVHGWESPVSLVDVMRARLYSPRYFYEHRWQEGDLLLADNFSLLHGRRAFSDSSPRHLRRIQIR